MPQCCRVNLEKFHSEKGKRSHKCSYSTFLYSPLKIIPIFEQLKDLERKQKLF